MHRRPGRPGAEVQAGGGMSGAAARLVAPGALPAAAERRDSAPLRLLAFVALASFGVAHWWGMVVQAPTGRAVTVVAIATAGGPALAPPSGGRRPPLATGLACLVTLAMLAGGLMAAGLRAHLLLPG